MIIMAYIIIFSQIATFIFFSNETTDQSYGNIFNAMYTNYNMFILSNYPDVELPFFQYNRWSFFYFFSFLTIGIFLLSNLLLATVVNNYKLLIHKKLKKHEKNVRKYFQELFDKVDT